MNEIIKKHITEFKKEERDLTKRIKNLLIKCIEDNYILREKLKQSKEYHIWSLYPGGTITFEGTDEILKIEEEWHSYYEKNDCVDYNIYGKRGLMTSSAFTDIKLKEELLKSFKNNKIAEEIIDYLYSGKTCDTFEHLSWKNCIKDYNKDKK